MAILEVPAFIPEVNYVFSIEWDAVVFTMRFAFNNRDAHWYFSLENDEGVELRSGIKLVEGFPLLARYKDVEARPLGEFLATDPSGADRDPLADQLGKEIFLVYIEQSSLP